MVETQGDFITLRGPIIGKVGESMELSQTHLPMYFPAMENAQVERFTHQFIIYEGNGMPDRFNGRLLVWMFFITI